MHAHQDRLYAVGIAVGGSEGVDEGHGDMVDVKAIDSHALPYLSHDELAGRA